MFWLPKCWLKCWLTRGKPAAAGLPRVKITLTSLPTNHFVSTATNSMKCLVTSLDSTKNPCSFEKYPAPPWRCCTVNWTKSVLEVEPASVGQNSTHVSNRINKNGSKFVWRELQWEALSIPTSANNLHLLLEQEALIVIEKTWTKPLSEVMYTWSWLGSIVNVILTWPTWT